MQWGRGPVDAGMPARAFIRAIGAEDDVIVDLSDLVFADTSLMLDLAMLARRLRVRGRTILLRGAQPQIWTMIEMWGCTGSPASTSRAPPRPSRKPRRRPRLRRAAVA